MKFNHFFLFMVVVFIKFLYSAEQQNTFNDLASLHKAIKTLDSALQQRNMKLVSEMYSNDAYMMQDDGQIIKGKDAITQFWKRGLPNAELSIQNVELKKDGNTAYRIFNYFYKFLRKGQSPFILKGKSLHIWHMQPDGSWELHVDMWNSSMRKAN